MGVRSFVLVPALAAFATVIACNVSPTAPATTGGVPFDAGGGQGGGADDASATDAGASADAGDASPPVVCDHGSVVLLTDYTSTQIALATRDGTVQSAAFLSTASTKASGLAFALSGDVALPNVTPPSGRVVLIDRYGTNVLTWADPATAKVYGQLPVGTGFESNPQDYVEIDATHAYVSRWGVNDKPGMQPFDSGSDVLVVDNQALAITQSIAMPVEDTLPPRPAGMLRVGDTVMVVLQRTSEDFMTVGESALVGLRTQPVGDAGANTIAWNVHVTGLKNCDRPTLSPSGRIMAMGCQGQLDMNGNVSDLSTSAVVLFDVTTSPPKELRRFPVSDQLGAAPQSGVAWMNDGMILGKTQTPLGGTTNNQAFALDLGTGKATVLLTAGRDSMGKGKGLVYGDVRCHPGCGDVCMLADGDTGKLRRWSFSGGALQPLSDVTVDPTTGLPPASLGGY